MPRRFGMTPLVILPAVLLAGCARDVPEPSAPSGPDAASVAASGDQPAAPPGGHEAGVTLRTADEAELARVVAAYRGKVVLVDFWATWCLPCVELFPHTVALDRRLRDRGLAVISVSFDEPESEPAIRRFLTEKKATFDNFLSPYGITAKAWEAFGIEDGALPHIRIYGRVGNVRKTFGAAGKFTGEDIDRAVESLLDES